jgi:hypothetical protein
MDHETRAFVLRADSSYRVTQHYAQVVSRVTLDDVEYITSADMNVYVSHHLFNLHTGVVEELWLTKAQMETYRQTRDFPKPNPRMFDLPEIGLPQESSTRTNKVVEGHLSPDSLTSVRQDKGGHWWAGERESQSIRPYMTEPIRKGNVLRRPELRFLFPHLSYLGPDDDVWYEEWRAAGRRTRLTLCSHEVSKVVSSHGVWGHYFPKGKARTDVKVAGRQAAKYRAAMVDYDKMKLEVKAAREETEVAEKRWHEAMDERNAANTEMRQAKDVLAARAEAHAEEVERLTELLREAEDRIFDLTPASGGAILNRV